MDLKKLFITFLFFTTLLKVSCQNDTLNLYYDIGLYKLNKTNYNKINDYIKSIKDSTTYKVKIISSADFLGTEKSNFELSQKRADFIKQLLKIKNEKAFTSFEVINNGEITNNNQINLNKEGNAEDRKTILVFNKRLTFIDEEQQILTPKKDSIKISKEFGTIEVGKKFILKNLIFEIGTDKLKKKSYSELTKLVRLLKKNPNIEIEIGGHVCCNADYRKPNPKTVEKLKGSELSTKRARFVYKYLFYKGIKKKRMTYYGYGFQLPIYYPEKSKKDMNANKRVEISITKI